MSDTPETEHFACALQMQSMQNQIEELTDMLRNTERGLATMTEQRDRLAEAIRKHRDELKLTSGDSVDRILWNVLDAVEGGES
jgi:conjugal transfer/entry exclusion protein